jgi:hypothetical protein
MCLISMVISMYSLDGLLLNVQVACDFYQAYIHSRMRAKTSDFLKVLNRARPEPKTAEKKTIT